MITYTKATKEVVNTVAADIKVLVEDSIDGLATTQVMPIILSIFISLFIPMILYLTFKATMSMLTYVNFKKTLNIDLAYNYFS